MAERLKNFNFMHAVAVLTWAVVAGSSLYYFSRRDGTGSEELLLPALLFVAFICAWLFTTEDNRRPGNWFYVSVVIQWCCFVALFWLLPYVHVAIISILWSGIFVHVTRLSQALLISAIAVYIPFTAIFSLHWEHSAVWINAILFFTFNVFAAVMMHVSEQERLAREQAELFNAELQATQTLLQQATKQSERIRIARNIHDLLGHHLTALTIKLQFASLKTTGDSKDSVDECLHIAKLLLSDVREAVSEMREQQAMNLREALDTMICNTPRLSITLNMDEDTDTQDVAIAQGIVRSIQESITNTLKHSHSNHMTINLQKDNDLIQVYIEDSGDKTILFTEGNGLKGIRERLAQLGGSASFEATSKGFVTQLSIPVEAP